MQLRTILNIAGPPNNWLGRNLPAYFCLALLSPFVLANDIYVRKNSDPFQAPYYIFSSSSGGPSETFSLERGSTYSFIRTDDGHPFNIGAGWMVPDPELSSTSTSSTNLVGGVGSIISGQSLSLAIPEDFSKATVTYFCAAHSSMVSTLAVVSGDSEAPVITLFGDNPQTIEAGSSYVEAGASADGGEAVTIDSSAVDTGTVGNYTVTYTATDAAGNSASVTRTVKVVNSSFVDTDQDGYSDSDELEWGSNPLDQNDAPIESLNWSLFAGIGTSPSIDTTAPVITLIGPNPQSLEVGSNYVESGATTDTGETVVIDASDLNTAVVGSYSVTYNATDASGNVAATVIRTVNVVDSGSAADTTPPVITLNGSNPQTVQINSAYVEAGAVTDSGEAVVIDSSEVDTSALGSYVVTYDATDASGNVAETVTRTVNVVDSSNAADTTPPVITLNGSNPQTVQLNDEYVEAGATTDSGEPVVIDASQVNTSAVGSYIVTYTAQDAAGNSATPVTRTVNVIDSSAVYSKSSALTTIVDNIVIPNVESLAAEAAAFAAEGGVLQDYGESLTSDTAGGGYYKTEADSLLAAQIGWKQLMRVVQANDMHILGPAARNKQDLRNRIHGYYLGGPSLDSFDEFSSCGTDVLVVRANDGTREVADSNINTRGMVALEYLLFNDDLTHSCSSGVSAVSGWNALPESARKSQRYDLALEIAQDIALNAGKIRDDWSSYRTEFLDTGEVGTNFQLLTDSLFYFEKYSKSAKLAAVVGQDRLCAEDLCPRFIESSYSETSLRNLKANAEQFLSIYDSGLDNLVDESDSGFSALFKGLISDVVNMITELENSGTPLSLKAHVAAIQTDGAVDACGNAFANPDSEGDPQICTLAGKMKKVTDKLKIEFVTYLGVSLPEAAQGDTD